MTTPPPSIPGPEDDAPRVEEVEQQHVLAVREEVAMGELTQFFDRALGVVMEALQRQAMPPAGPPFARYRGEPSATVDVEVGFPVGAPAQADGTATPGVLPACRAVVAWHVGPYDRLSATYETLDAWVTAHQLTPGPEMWEQYVSDPGAEPDPETWRTRIVWPLVGAGPSDA